MSKLIFETQQKAGLTSEVIGILGPTLEMYQDRLKQHVEDWSASLDTCGFRTDAHRIAVICAQAPAFALDRIVADALNQALYGNRLDDLMLRRLEEGYGLDLMTAGYRAAVRAESASQLKDFLQSEAPALAADPEAVQLLETFRYELTVERETWQAKLDQMDPFGKPEALIEHCAVAPCGLAEDVRYVLNIVAMQGAMVERLAAAARPPGKMEEAA